MAQGKRDDAQARVAELDSIRFRPIYNTVGLWSTFLPLVRCLS